MKKFIVISSIISLFVAIPAYAVSGPYPYYPTPDICTTTKVQRLTQEQVNSIIQLLIAFDANSDTIIKVSQTLQPLTEIQSIQTCVKNNGTSA